MTEMGKWVKTIEKTDESAVSDHELDPNMKEKELLFAPYIFIIDETISSRKKLATAIRERGGKVKVKFLLKLVFKMYFFQEKRKSISVAHNLRKERQRCDGSISLEQKTHFRKTKMDKRLCKIRQASVSVRRSIHCLICSTLIQIIFQFQ